MYSGSSSTCGAAAACGAISIPGKNHNDSGDSGDENTPNGRSIYTPQSNSRISHSASNRIITTEEDVCSSQSSSSPRRNFNSFPVPQPTGMLASMRRDREYVDEIDNEHLIDSDDASWVRPCDHTRTRSDPIVPITRERSKDSSSQLDEKVETQDEEMLNIAKFPTAKLLDMLTALLDKIVKSNDKLADSNPALSQERELMSSNNVYLNSVLSFRGKHIPQISLDHYFQRIQKYCPTTNDVFLSLLVYFDRISKRCNSNNNETHNNNELQYDIPEENKEAQQEGGARPQQQAFVMDSHNIHRLLIAGVTVSTKFFSDFFYSNSRYARVGGISLQELNHLELQFLVLCDFELLISVNELQRYANLLYKFWNNSNMVDAPVAEPEA